ncbi:uncharacterized protein LOC105702872 [Orussus abietinus]|uniref:uncharacterized protein LOC105702872 n=1 Tax=Orussus abietinus TaxID=222816 RepID=UPI0006257693|nr:uncharacterized protein LOC105702872 [Orussus abietinus]XP_012286227.1 uncharacterized protein LOC105702872 [Orussus abietinus]
MNTQAESILAFLYSASLVLSVTSAVSLVVAWQHWSWTLDVCINIDCGCILYGVNTFSTFMGGDAKLCHFGVSGLAPAAFFGLCLGGYHGYRVCIDKGPEEPRRASRAVVFHDRITRGDVVVIGPKRRSPFKQWMSAAFLGALIGCLSLAHAVVLTDGYYKTCEQYKRNLVQLLGSRGREIQVIHNRLSCGAVLDFMDYLQPDANNWRRGDEINTGLALQLAIVASWFNFFAWAASVVVNAIMARRRVRDSGEKLCCFC